MSAIPDLNSSASPYHIHWHVLIIHFPISFFVAAFGFQVLHLFRDPACYEKASNAALIAGTVMLAPTVLTGWRTWHAGYQGVRVPIFRRKILIAFVMLGLSIGLVAWRMAFPGIFEDPSSGASHWTYLAGTILLMLGAAAEGYYGGRLNHR